jgi:PIN domain nuclease of toxin-antitoxin system
MSASVLLDTSFLITLVNEDRPHHQTAKAYYSHMLGNNIPMYFSAIVASEFAIKQPVYELPLNNFRLIQFNIAHGQLSARLWNALGTRDQEDVRAVVRDDVKIIAQACHESITHVLTEDVSSLYKYCERLRAENQIAVRAIKLVDGFVASSLREDGQIDWVGDPIDEDGSETRLQDPGAG